jgi:autotransporter-associated beta strand protein
MKFQFPTKTPSAVQFASPDSTPLINRAAAQTLKSRSRKGGTARAVALIMAGVLATSWSAVMAAETILLGTAESFSVLGATTVTNTGPTKVYGDVGLSPGTSVTGFPPGILIGGTIHIKNAQAIQGQADALTAYTQLAAEATTINLSGTNLGGLTLVPGVYRFDSAAQLTGTLTLDTGGDPNAAFHFQIGTDVTTGAGSSVVLMGLPGGTYSNVFWQVGSSATLGSGTAFNGSILALTSITLNTGATILDGRAIALNGAVTLDTNTIRYAGLVILDGEVWSGNANNLWSATNWSPDVSGATSSTLAPAADVVFSVTGVAPQNQNTILDFDATISSLTVNDPAAVTISGTNLLAINGAGVGTGITINTGAGLTTINTDLELSGPAQAVTVHNAAGLVINGQIGGAIGLTKAGTGQLTLSGANTYVGATAIQQGTVLAAATNVIPNASAVSVNAGSTFDLGGFAQSVGSIANGAGGGGFILLSNAPLVTGNDNTDTLFSGIISGPGSITKVGTGTWTLGGGNAYTGATAIDGGTVLAAAANVIPSRSAVSVASGATLDLDGFNQSIGSLAGAGAVGLGSAALVTGNDSRSTVYSGVISGPGSVRKVGAGTWTVTGQNTYAGTTTLSAGTLILDGSVAGDAAVSGGTLRGTGRIGGSLLNNAVVNPGHATSVGTLSVGGSFTQNSPGALNIRLASPTSYDKLVIGGSAMLGGALNVGYLNGFNATPGDSFVILTAANGVNGTFSSFNDAHATGTLLSLEVVYRSNDVLLEIVQGSFTDLSEANDGNANEMAVSQALDKLASREQGNKLIQELNQLQLSEVFDALSLLSSEDFAAIFTAGLAVSQVQVGNIERRLDEVRQGSSGFSDSGFAVSDSHGAQNFDGKSSVGVDGKTSVGLEGKGSKEVVEASSGNEHRWGFFIAGTGEVGDLETTDRGRGSSFLTGGVTVGADYRVNRNFVVGAAVGYANTSSDLSRGGDLEFNSGKASLYGTYYEGGFYLNGIIGAGYGSFETKRRTFGGFAYGETDALDFNALLGTGYDFRIGAWTIGPVASVQYSRVEIDSFAERGALGAMRFDSQGQDSVKSAVGLKASYTKRVGGVVLRPEIRAQWQHEYLDDRSSIDAGFSSSSSFTVHGPQIGRDALLVDVGASVQLTDRTAIFSYYTGELGRENYTVHSVNAGLRVSF